MKTIKLFLLLLLINFYTLAQGFDTSLNKNKKEIKELVKGHIKLDVTIKIDNKIVEDSIYIVEVHNCNTGFKSSIHLNNKFVLYLDYNTEFEICFKYKNTNSKIINVNTHVPIIENWYLVTNINLNKDNQHKTIIAGGIKYDELAQTFKKY